MTLDHPDLSIQLAGIALLVLVATAAWYDVRQGRIPNRLCVAGLIAALLIRTVAGWDGLAAGLIGAVIAFAVSLPLFMLRGLGAGDVKLLTVVGAFLGPARLPVALFAVAVSGGILAAAAITARRAWPTTLSNLRKLLISMDRRALGRWKGDPADSALTIDSDNAITVPYAMAIGIGALAGWLL